MSKIEVDAITEQSGTTLTTGGGAGKTVVVDATTVTLGRCGGTVALASGATQSGFGRTGTVDWQTTPKTGDFTAVNGEGYFVNTTSGAITMTMPSGSAGAIVSIQDYNKTFDSNAFTISPASGEKINGGGANVDLIILTEGQGLTFVYVDATVGWKTVHENEFIGVGSNFIVASGGTETICGNCKIHTFTGPGTFTIDRVAVCAADNVVSHVVIAGGGGGGGNRGGGGGGGGYREVVSPSSPYTGSPLNGYPSAPNRVTVTATAFPITVGGGGAGQPNPTTNGAGGQGGSSIFSTITSAGGGGGRDDDSPKPGNPTTNGGSGGGSGGGGNVLNIGGSGNTPPVSPAQGTDGGSSTTPGPAPLGNHGGGGGGATVAGRASNSPGCRGFGGTGATSSINGTPTGRAGGGGAGSAGPGAGACGVDGGGDGGDSNNGSSDCNGTANTGGGAGGGAGSGGAGGTGGSGIVIIRYKFQ